MAPAPGAAAPGHERDDETPDSSLLRKTTIGIAGGGLVAAGIVMLVTPGPGLLTIAGGLTVLSREFATADRLVNRMRRETLGRIRGRADEGGDDPAAGSP